VDQRVWRGIADTGLYFPQEREGLAAFIFLRAKRMGLLTVFIVRGLAQHGIATGTSMLTCVSVFF
jgi:hypothetical protein